MKTSEKRNLVTEGRSEPRTSGHEMLCFNPRFWILEPYSPLEDLVSHGDSQKRRISSLKEDVREKKDLVSEGGSQRKELMRTSCFFKTLGFGSLNLTLHWRISSLKEDLREKKDLVSGGGSQRKVGSGL